MGGKPEPCEPEAPMSSKWLEWTPRSGIKENPREAMPSKPSEPGFAGFVASAPATFPIAPGPSSAKAANLPLPIPAGLHLIRYQPKEPPILIESYAVVMDQTCP